MLGKIARINELLGPKDKLASYDYLINLVTQLYVAQKNARENVVEAKIKSKNHNKKINLQTFKLEDLFKPEDVFLLKGPKSDKSIYRIPRSFRNIKPK